MGKHHARVYRQLTGSDLVGVVDLDRPRAQAVAGANGASEMDLSSLLDRVDAVSVAVPTSAHFEIDRECIEAGVDVLVEKPFVENIDEGQKLAAMAHDAGVVLQVGHIERFNPAVQTMLEVLDDGGFVASSARRLGPPANRPIEDGVIRDLMIHDLDIHLAMAESMPESIEAATCNGGEYATAILTFPNGRVSTLTASRITQRRIRELHITTNESQVSVDYLDQSVHIHRQSLPEYVQEDGNLRYRNNSVVEQPFVEREEPLKNQLESFLEASRTDSRPVVTAEDGLRVLTVATRIEEQARRLSPEVD